jgi:hypothetical protein
MDLRSHGCAGLSERDGKLAMKHRLKSLQSLMQCRDRCHSHCNTSCPRTVGKYAVITSSVAPAARRGGRIDGQPASWVLLRFVLVDVGYLEVWGALDGPETRSEHGYPTCVFLSTFMVSVLERGVGDVLSRPSPDRATG